MSENSKSFLLILPGMLTAMWLFIAATLLCLFATDIRPFIAPPPKHPCRLNATGVFITRRE